MLNFDYNIIWQLHLWIEQIGKKKLIVMAYILLIIIKNFMYLYFNILLLFIYFTNIVIFEIYFIQFILK